METKKPPENRTSHHHETRQEIINFLKKNNILRGQATEEMICLGENNESKKYAKALENAKIKKTKINPESENFHEKIREGKEDLERILKKYKHCFKLDFENKSKIFQKLENNLKKIKDNYDIDSIEVFPCLHTAIDLNIGDFLLKIKIKDKTYLFIIDITLNEIENKKNIEIKDLIVKLETETLENILENRNTETTNIAEILCKKIKNTFDEGVKKHDNIEKYLEHRDKTRNEEIDKSLGKTKKEKKEKKETCKQCNFTKLPGLNPETNLSELFGILCFSKIIRNEKEEILFYIKMIYEILKMKNKENEKDGKDEIKFSIKDNKNIKSILSEIITKFKTTNKNTANKTLDKKIQNFLKSEKKDTCNLYKTIKSIFETLNITNTTKISEILDKLEEHNIDIETLLLDEIPNKLSKIQEEILDSC